MQQRGFIAIHKTSSDVILAPPVCEGDTLKANEKKVVLMLIVVNCNTICSILSHQN